MPLPVIILAVALLLQQSPTNQLPPQFRGAYRQPPLKQPYAVRFVATRVHATGVLSIEQKRMPDGWREVAKLQLNKAAPLPSSAAELELADAKDKSIILLVLLLDDERRQLDTATITVSTDALKKGLVQLSFRLLKRTWTLDCRKGE